MDALELAVEEISAEISWLKEQRRTVQMEAERAAERLKELNHRRTAFAPNAFSNERGGVAEKLANVTDELSEALDDESEVISRTKAHAEDAVRKLDQRIMKTEVEYGAAKKRVAQMHYEELCKERYAHDEDAEEVVGVLVKILEQLEAVYENQARIATEAENTYFTDYDPHHTIGNWLVRRLNRWLPLESPDKYDEPLPDLDPLALNPTSDQTVELRSFK